MMHKFATALLLSLLCGAVEARTVFESDGASMAGWETQWHPTSDASSQIPVWSSDGTTIKGAAFYSAFYGADLGGVMFNTNSFSVEVGEVVTLTADLQGKGVLAPDNLNHWWFSFGFRTGGDHPWDYGELAAYATIQTGIGHGSPYAFTFWNNWSDLWTDPRAFCAVPADDSYLSDTVTVTFSVERTEEGFGPSIIVVSNHTTGVRSMATGLGPQANRNDSAASNLFVYCEMLPEFDGPGGFSTVGSEVRFRSIKLTVGDRHPPLALAELSNGSVPVENTDPYIRSIRDIKRLSNEEAEKSHETLIDGQVLSFHPEQTRLFLYDGRSGLYIELGQPAGEIEGLKVGSLVRCKGITLSGGYSPIVYSGSLEVTGWEPLPHPRRLDQTLYRSTSIDVDWVEIEGRPVAMELVQSYGHFLITMELLESSESTVTTMDVFVPYSDDAVEKMKSYMYHRVRLSGVLATTANNRHQMTDRILYINSLDDFRLISGSPGTVPRSVPIHDFMQYGKESRGLVKTQGTVISAMPDTLYLRGDRSNLKAFIFHENKISPGDLVELTGYVGIHTVSPIFRAVAVSRLKSGPEPEPVDIRIDTETIDPDWNYELVRLDAEFIHVEKTYTRRYLISAGGKYQDIIRESLWCRVGARIFEVQIPEGVSIYEKLRPGSMVRLTGICHVSETKNPRLEQMTGSLWLELLDESSIVVIKQVSWWTPRRLLFGLLGTLLASVLFLIWVAALRKTVARQTQTIGQQLVRETTLNERQRIARELHDTMEQGLTALSFQIRRAARKVRSDPAGGQEVLGKAEKMLQVCRDESRASIQDLRGGILEEMDLPSAIREMVTPQLDETALDLSRIDFSVDVTGNPVRLTLFAEHQLLRMITEATHNAILHASPNSIQIRMYYKAERLEITVEDDGCGFDPEEVITSGRFGIMGMHERANRLNGNLSIESEPGKGTRILLNLPIQDFIKESKL